MTIRGLRVGETVISVKLRENNIHVQQTEVTIIVK